MISIHVPRVEDDAVFVDSTGAAVISIHVPRVEDDSKIKRKIKCFAKFQSTSPVWRTTGGYDVYELIAK